MALTCSTGSLSSGAPADRYSAAIVVTNNGFAGANDAYYTDGYSQWGLSVVTENLVLDGSNTGTSGSWTGGTTNDLYADVTYKYRAKAVNNGPSATGTTKTKKTGAIAATASTPTSSGITSSAANIACNYYPNVNESTCSAQLQYKRTVDSTWINAGTAGTLGDYVQRSATASLTGLDPSTSYNVRLVITRTTTTGTSLTSATHSFTTLAGNPAVTTNATTGVTAGVSGVANDGIATLNGTLDINEGTGVNCFFRWGASNPPTENTTANQSKSADGAFQQAISGLTESATYYVQAFASYTFPGSGSPVSGSVVSFTVPADPEAVAAKEDHMLVYEYDRKYGVITDGTGQAKIIFAVADDSTDSSDRFINEAVPWVAGDVKISIDGGAVASTTNLPARIGSTPLYALTLTAAEMQGSDIYVYLVDADGPEWRDTLLHVRTHLTLGTVDIDAATGQKANATAFKVTGYGSGHGLSAVSGATGKDINGLLGSMVLAEGNVTTGTGTSATLTDGFAATNDYYNGAVILFYAGTGAGQARVITDFVGATGVATLNKSLATGLGADTDYVIVPGPDVWATGPYGGTAPGVELASLPTKASSYADMLQFVFQRFVYKRTQTATAFTMYKDNGSDTLASGGVDDDGTTQSHNELA